MKKSKANPTKVRTSEKSQLEDKEVEQKLRKTKGLKKLTKKLETK